MLSKLQRRLVLPVSVRAYNTPVERLSSSSLVGMDVTGVSNLIDILQFEYGLSLPQSIVALQVALRVLHIPMQMGLRWALVHWDEKLKSSKWYHKLVTVDMMRDSPNQSPQ
jgi:hypothetical protein